MKAFCEKCSPGLFDIVEDIFTSSYSSSLSYDCRTQLRRQRVVGELYRLAYLSNQVKIIDEYLI